jgi:hypothetical protein
MLRLEFEEGVYEGPENWSEVTLGQFIELCNVKIPEKLRALWVASAKDDDDEYQKVSDQIGVPEVEKIFPEYYGKMMALLTTIPGDVIERIHGPAREQFFNLHLRYLIYSSFARYPVHVVDGKLEMYDPDPVEKFELDGVEYYLPKSLKVYGEVIPMGKEQAITFAEASDIEVALREMAEGAANRLPMFVAIYCREKGKKYDEDETLRRAEKFNELGMDHVWRVFFCIYRQLTRLQNYTPGYLREAEQKLVEKLENPG